jgi:hypothetical protein
MKDIKFQERGFSLKTGELDDEELSILNPTRH